MKHLSSTLLCTIRPALLRTLRLALLCAMACGCVEYDGHEFDGHTLPRVTGYQTGVTHDWLYVRLATGEMLNAAAPNRDMREGDQRQRLDWDIAFCGQQMRTNSGTSGPGQAAAADLGYGGYGRWQRAADLPEDLEWTPDNDTTVEITYSATDWNKYLLANNLDFDLNPWFDPNSGPATLLTSANPVLSRAVTFSAPPPTYTPSMHTYAIRSASGQEFYKLQVVSWYDATVEIGGEGGRISYYLDKLD